jgi:hypothetical protein
MRQRERERENETERERVEGKKSGGSVFWNISWRNLFRSFVYNRISGTLPREMFSLGSIITMFVHPNHRKTTLTQERGEKKGLDRMG